MPPPTCLPADGSEAAPFRRPRTMLGSRCPASVAGIAFHDAQRALLVTNQALRPDASNAYWAGLESFIDDGALPLHRPRWPETASSPNSFPGCGSTWDELAGAQPGRARVQGPGAPCRAMREPAMLAPEPGPGEDWFHDDPALRRFLELYEEASVLKAAEPLLAGLGRAAPRVLDPLARQADRHRPVLRRASPEDDGTVDYDASYLELRRLAREHRAFTLSWEPLAGKERGPRTLHFALGYLYAQAEGGYLCPGCMTDGAAWVLQRHAPRELRDFYVPRLVQPRAEGAWEGAMLLTERAGGSDVGQTQTRAEPAEGGLWRLWGEKWFASNCTAEVILTLARLPGGAPGTEGLGLFLVPRALPDGRANPGVWLRKLKDKLGVASMATAEVEFRGCKAFLLAGEGQGFKAMAEMVNLSRLYNAVASVAIARRALREGLRQGATRSAFGALLKDQPLYRVKLAELAVEVEGALAVVLEAAHAMDRAAREPEAQRLLRALTPLAKACTAKLAVKAASEACELLGGNGYVEDYVTPRLLRDAQVLPIWEGTTNIQALDVLRAARREGALEALTAWAQRLLDEAARRPQGIEALLPELRARWAALGRELAGLLAEPEPAQQAAAWRLTQDLYHASAGTLLARAAARLPQGAECERAAVLAEVYVALHVHQRGGEGLRALERAALAHGEALAYGARA